MRAIKWTAGTIFLLALVSPLFPLYALLWIACKITRQDMHQQPAGWNGYA